MPPPREPGSGLGWALGAVALVVVLVALAVLLDLGPFADDELSRAEFVAAADTICGEAHDAFLELQRDPPQTAREAGDLASRLAEIAGEERDRIADLNGPPEIEAGIGEYLEAREKGIEALEAGVDAAEDGDSLAYASLQAEVADAQLERRRIAARLGLRECSRPLEGRSELERDAEPPR